VLPRYAEVIKEGQGAIYPESDAYEIQYRATIPEIGIVTGYSGFNSSSNESALAAYETRIAYSNAQSLEVTTGRVPDWLSDNNNILLNDGGGFYGFEITGVDNVSQTYRVKTNYTPGFDSRSFFRDLSAQLPTNMVVYLPYFKEDVGMIPMFLHQGETYLFIEPERSS